MQCRMWIRELRSSDTCRIMIPQSDASALIVVLWVIGLLSILASSFTFDAHIEARITSYYRKRTKAEYLARSGIEIARLLMMQSAEIKKKKRGTEEKEEEWWYGDAKRLSDGLAIHGLVHELGEGVVILDITPEPARQNVNLLKEEDWERILEVAGVPEDMWPGLVPTFYDWIDKDDVARIDGAETEDYYAALEPPYHAKNGPLDTVEELLLVKGFNRAILSGGVIETGSEDEEPIEISGISDLLTTYGDGKVNVNAASQRVLMTLPGVDEIVAGAIIEEREGWIDDEGHKENTSFVNVDDFLVRVPGLLPSIRDYVATDSAIYRITSVGMVQGVRKEVWCIGKYADKNLTILRWREEE